MATKRVPKSEVTTGLLINHITLGEIAILEDAGKGPMVLAGIWNRDGSESSRLVRVADLRWQ